MELSTFRAGIAFGHHQNSTDVVEWHTAVTFMSNNNSLTTAVVVTTDYIKQPVNGSLCRITSLQVYRGRRHIAMISHDGFFLSDEGIFRVYNYVNTNLHGCMPALMIVYMILSSSSLRQ